MNSSTDMGLIDIIPGPNGGRILCVSDIRGDYKRLLELIEETKAVAVIHTGDWGFLDENSPGRMSPRVLRHTLQYTPLIPQTVRPSILAHAHGPHLFSLLSPPEGFMLSQLHLLLSGALKLPVPVYVVYGPTEDIRVLEKFRMGESGYEVENLNIVDEAITRVLEVGGVRFRLLGLGGSLQMAKIFDNGEGTGTIAGGNGMVWATALQIGELVDIAQKAFDPTETRLLITHSSIGREGLLAQLSLVLKADLTISGSLHFRFIASFNEFNVQTDQDLFKEKLLRSKKSFMDIYESAKPQLDSAIQPDQKEYLQKAIQVAQKIPTFDGSSPEEDTLWKNCWNWNLAEAGYGDLILIVKEGRVSAETHSSGFNFGYRRHAKTKAAAQTNSVGVLLPSVDGSKSVPTTVHVPQQSQKQQLAYQSHQQQQDQKTIPPPPYQARKQQVPTGPSSAQNNKPVTTTAPTPAPAKPLNSSSQNVLPNQQNQNRSSQPTQTKPPPNINASAGPAKQASAATAPASQPIKPTGGDAQDRRVNGAGNGAGSARQLPPHQQEAKGGPRGNVAPQKDASATTTSAVASSSTTAPNAKAAGPEGAGSAKKAPRGKKEQQPAKAGAAAEAGAASTSAAAAAAAAAAPAEQSKPREKGGRNNRNDNKPTLPAAAKEGAASTSVNGSAPATPATEKAAANVHNWGLGPSGEGDNSSANGSSTTAAGGGAAAASSPSPANAPPPGFSLLCSPLHEGCTETELKNFFNEDVKAKITRVRIPYGGGKTGTLHGYVEFASEADMNAGATGHAETLKDATIEVKALGERKPRQFNNRGGYRGGSRGHSGGHFNRGRGGGSGTRGGAVSAAT